MAGKLNPSLFLSIQDIFKKRCKTLFIEAYQTSISENSISLDLEENDITAILHNSIDENLKRKKWNISTNIENHLFDISNKRQKGFAAKFSRIDMRFSQFWKAEECKYYVEAKNIKSNDSGLKRRYINTGINNFLSGGKYFDCEGFLVGYILEGTAQNCLEGINKLLKKDKRENEIIKKGDPLLILDNYLSHHEKRILEHLFFDYTKPIGTRLELINLPL